MTDKTWTAPWEVTDLETQHLRAQCELLRNAMATLLHELQLRAISPPQDGTERMSYARAEEAAHNAIAQYDQKKCHENA